MIYVLLVIAIFRNEIYSFLNIKRERVVSKVKIANSLWFATLIIFWNIESILHWLQLSLS